MGAECGSRFDCAGACAGPVQILFWVRVRVWVRVRLQKKLLVLVRSYLDFGCGCGCHKVRVRFGSAVEAAVLNSFRGSSS